MDKLKDYLSHKKPQVKVKTKASVLIPIIEIKGEYHVLFEVRSYDLKGQPGEVCFPGGHIEPHEKRKTACIRETCEELLIESSQIEIIGAMDGHYTSNRLIWPFIGILHDYEMTYSIDEVDHVFTVPLSYLLDYYPDIHKVETETKPSVDFPYDLIPNGEDYHWFKGKRDIYFYQYNDEVIWGLTAKILYDFIQLYKTL